MANGSPAAVRIKLDREHFDVTDRNNGLLPPGVELGEFKPCVIYNEELRLTEMVLKDVSIVWCPWGPTKGHAVDCGYDMEGNLVAIKIWDDVRTRPVR